VGSWRSRPEGNPLARMARLAAMPHTQFRPGDHLAVRRRYLYWHHGIYVSDSRVIEFGRGDVLSTRRLVIRPVTLSKFDPRGAAVVVQHPRRFLAGLGVGLPPSQPPDEIIARAEWLVGACPPGRYNLWGSNCEHVANWCAAGGYFESLQIRSSFAALALLSAAVILSWGRLSPRVRLAALLILPGMTLGPAIYNVVPYLAWKEVLDQWSGPRT